MRESCHNLSQFFLPSLSQLLILNQHIRLSLALLRKIFLLFNTLQPPVLKELLRLREDVKAVAERHPFSPLDEFIARLADLFVVRDDAGVDVHVVDAQAARLWEEFGVLVVRVDRPVGFQAFGAQLLRNEVVFTF